MSDAGVGGTTEVGQIMEPEPPIEPPEVSAPAEGGQVPQTGTVADAVVLNGKLPGEYAPRVNVRTMPASDDPNLAAQDYIKRAYNGQTPSITPGEDGGFIATLPDGAIITFRPAGQASVKTESSTASVDINDPKISQLNGGRPLKLKFPKK